MNSNQSLEQELGIPVEAKVLPETSSWSLRNTSGGVGGVIPLSRSTSLRRSTTTQHQPRCLIVGRQASTADIRIQHGSISRKHAVFYIQGSDDELVLRELGSKHGVYVNGRKISGGVKLQSGDKLIFGNVRDNEFMVEFQGDNIASIVGAADQKKSVAGTNAPNEDVSKDTEDKPAAEGPGAGLTGRAKREAEIAAMMASLDNTPAYTTYVPEQEEPVQQEQPEQPSSVNESIVDKYSLPATERFEIAPVDNSDNDTRKGMLTCFAVDRAGSRFVTGGTDTYLRMYDFSGMDQYRQEPFKTLQVEEGHVVVDACYSNTGDRLLVATGSVQPKVLDRDGGEIIQFVRGDMYVIDPVRTSGHTAPVTGVSWNPLERDIVATSSLDGSARIWNLNGKTQFKKLVCDKVYRGKNSRGQKVGVTSVAFHPSGRELAFGTADGSIQIWNATKVSARPERATYDTHGEGRPVHSLVFSVDGSRVASRSIDDDTVKLWDAKRMSRSSTPIVSCNGLPSVHENSNCSFSHDGRLLCAGTSEFEEASKGIRREFGYLKFYALPTSKAPVGEESSVSPILALNVSSVAGAVQVVWHSNLNQVLIGCSDGSVHIFYDSSRSDKGALAIASRAGRPMDELSQLLASRAPKGYTAVMGDVLTPNALPMFRGEKETKRKRAKDREDPVKSRRPEPPATGMKTGSQSGAAVNFTQFVSDSIVKTKNIAGKDPREELFRYSEGKSYVDQAYDTKILAEKTLEEEEEED